jgi:formate-dependent nitrite reductase membrane component NrfD
MFRPQFGSWLVRGGYTITGYGALLALWGAAKFLGFSGIETAALWAGAVFALVTAVYTAFLFGSAKGRDFWQSPLLWLHMLINSLIAGGSATGVIGFAGAGLDDSLARVMSMLLAGGFALHLVVMLAELYGKHPSMHAERAADIIRHGALKQQFWAGSVVLGNLLPMLAVLAVPSPVMLAVAGLFGLIGVFFTEKVWVQAPQSVPLS